ncbi:phosphatidylglycerol lysyltransferase domain-containing protein [Archangium violaceum]|uniref:phosphatidylglycerol lysyltransferase domain-containing protein n=1 Tax=Archangium violaceum TaxID=83451 RepID=UPI001F2E9C37|nr:phosphatidylglycerol lysyltransferase domain-containing protein [Archangium violaceum]
MGPGALPRYLDLGLTLLNLGEEAMVPLADFSLEGLARKSLRQSVHKLEREGYVCVLTGVASLVSRGLGGVVAR